MAVTFGLIHKTVAVSSTAERLSATALWVAWVVIQVKGGNNAGTGANTGKVFIGPSTVDETGTTGIQLPAPSTNSVPSALRIDSHDGSNQVNLQDIWLDVGVSGEGVVAYYAQRT